MSGTLLLGASGQVGTALLRRAVPLADVHTPSSADINLSAPQNIRAVLDSIKPDVIINCAAFTRVDDAETDTRSAFAINAEAPRALAEWSHANNARLIHVSTDYVFDGSGTPPFTVDSPVAPLNQYGASKLAGERAVLDACKNAIVVRTAWVHSGGGVNFVATAVRVLSKGGVMRVVDDQVSTPTRASNLAGVIQQLVQRREITGLLQFTDAGVASWYDVAECVLEVLTGQGKNGVGAAVVPVDSSVFPRPAKRPQVSLMDKHATWTQLGMTPSHWRAGVIASTQEILDA